MARRAKKTAKKTAKTTAKKAPTKSEVFGTIADKTDISKRDIALVFSELNPIIRRSLRSSGGFTLPGLCKMTVKRKPATKARKGVNPFTSEEMVFKAKPASKAIRIRPLKNLKEMV